MISFFNKVAGCRLLAFPKKTLFQGYSCEFHKKKLGNYFYRTTRNGCLCFLFKNKLYISEVLCITWKFIALIISLFDLTNHRGRETSSK